MTNHFISRLKEDLDIGVRLSIAVHSSESLQERERKKTPYELHHNCITQLFGHYKDLAGNPSCTPNLYNLHTIYKCCNTLHTMGSTPVACCRLDPTAKLGFQSGISWRNCVHSCEFCCYKNSQPYYPYCNVISISCANSDVLVYTGFPRRSDAMCTLFMRTYLTTVDGDVQRGFGLLILQGKLDGPEGTCANENPSYEHVGSMVYCCHNSLHGFSLFRRRAPLKTVPNSSILLVQYPHLHPFTVSTLRCLVIHPIMLQSCTLVPFKWNPSLVIRFPFSSSQSVSDDPLPYSRLSRIKQALTCTI